MYLKKYTVAAFLLIALVGWYVYAYVTQDTISLSFFGINLPSVSIALLVIVPMVILYIASILHMGFYSIMGGLKLRKYEKDYDKIIDAICDAFLDKENRHHEFKTQRYKLLGRITDHSKVYPDSETLLDVSEPRLREILKVIFDIKNGRSVNLKKYNLSPENYLSVQNSKNRYKNGEITAEEIIINSSNVRRVQKTNTRCKRPR